MTAKNAETSSVVASLARKAQKNAEKAEQGPGQGLRQMSASQGRQEGKHKNTRKSELKDEKKSGRNAGQKFGQASDGNLGQKGSQQKTRNTRKASPGQARRQIRPTPPKESKHTYLSKIFLGISSTCKTFVLLFFAISLCIVFLCGMGVGFLWLYREATNSEFFATEHVEVLGNVRMSQQMVLDLADVHEGENSLSVSIANVEQALLKTPWVEEVSVKRILPNRFVIHIKERMPSFWVRRDGVLYYADIKGKVIAPVETKNFVSLPTLEVEEGMERDVVRLGFYLNDLKSGKFPVDYDAISAVRLSEAKGMELYLDDREMHLCIALNGWKDNLMRMSVTLGDLARRNELSRVQEIRSADGNVWVIQGL